MNFFICNYFRRLKIPFLFQIFCSTAAVLILSSSVSSQYGAPPKPPSSSYGAPGIPQGGSSGYGGAPPPAPSGGKPAPGGGGQEGSEVSSNFLLGIS